MTSNEIEFLKELDNLSRKYKIAIGGCGCCDSPYLCAIEGTDKNSGYVYEDKISWVDAGEYFNEDGENSHPPFVKDMK